MHELLLTKKKKGGPGADGPDPYWNNVSLLLPWGSGLIDLSPRPKTLQVNGTVTVGSVGPYDGAGSIRMGTSSSGLKIQDGNGEFAFPAGVDCTVECYIKISTRASQQMMGQWASPNIYQLTLYSGWLGWEGTAVGKKAGTTATGGPALNAFSHCAMSRIGGNSRLFLDGTMIASWADAANYAVVDATGFGVGRVFPQSGFAATNCDLGPVRITKGVGRYFDNFTPAAFATQGP